MLEMNEEAMRDFVKRSRWIYAKTMPWCPHFYALRKHAESDEEFVAVAEFIRSHGYDSFYYRAPRRYLDLAGWQYWTMGQEMESTTLINRARLERKGEPIEPNPREWKPLPWAEVWCPRRKRLVPRNEVS